MPNWKEYKLVDVCKKIGSGATPRGGGDTYLESGEYSLIRSQNVIDFEFSTNGLAFISEEQANKLNNVELEERDVLLNITGDSVARVCQVPNNILPARVNQHVAIIRPDKKILNPEFLKYSLLTPKFKEYMLMLSSSGATRNAITKGMIENFIIRAPDLPTQTAIAEILSSLDDKIELNNQINQELEALAQALFKQWFIDFEFPNENGLPYKSSGGEMVESELGEIPKGWSVKKLKEILTIKRGGSPRPIQDYMAPQGLPWVKISDATAINTPFLFSTKEFIKPEGLNKTILLKKGSLILSNSATPGLPKFLELDACIHDGWLHFQDIKELSYPFLYLLFLSIRENLVGRGNGSIFINLKTDILKEYSIVVPPNNALKKFDEISISILEQIKQSAAEIIELQRLRDTILPKLISGELEVSEVSNKIKGPTSPGKMDGQAGIRLVKSVKK